MPLDNRSLACLATCDPRLQVIAAEAIKRIPFTVICGHRSAADQQKAYDAGLSKAKPGLSKHNLTPSHAFDFIPQPFTDADWKAIGRFREVARVLCAVAAEMKTAARWGGTWSNNVDGPLGHLVDADHFETV